jgi:hypothetical protein
MLLAYASNGISVNILYPLLQFLSLTLRCSQTLQGGYAP